MEDRRDVVVEPMSDFGEALQQPVVSEAAESMKETSEMNPLSQMKTAEGPATTEQNCDTITRLLLKSKLMVAMR
ncbi:unnamed protein product [Rhodiola kirilowii]